MKAQSKIILDRFIGKPLACLLNLIVFPVGQVFPAGHDDSPDKVKTIAIAKFLGMGSILRATPLVKALKKKYPSAKYIIITALKNKALVENIGLFDGFFYIRDTSFLSLFVDTVYLLFKLWQARIDLYFDLEVYSAFSTIITTLSLARNRYGFYTSSTMFRGQLNTHMVYFNDYQNISTIYLQFARACGISETDYKIQKVGIREQAKLELANWMKKRNLSGKASYIVINPNASDLLLERRWPLDYFVLLINALTLSWHNPIFIVGSPDENPYVTMLREKLSEQAKAFTVDLSGEVSLEATMALIEKARLMITNDSGLYHMAVSFGIPVISLWGPVRPQHYTDDRNENNIIFYSRKIYCSPCIHRTDFPPCRGNNVCMKSISPKGVYKKACEILEIMPNADTFSMDSIYETECNKNFDIIVKSPQIKRKRKI